MPFEIRGKNICFLTNTILGFVASFTWLNNSQWGAAVVVASSTVWMKPFIEIVKGGNLRGQAVSLIDKRTRMDTNTRTLPFLHSSIALDSLSLGL